MLLAAGNFTNALYLLGMMLLILAVLRGTKKNLKAAQARGNQPDAACDGDTLELRPYTDKPAQLMRWEVEMHELARDISARLDSKITMLQKLLIDAEARERNLGRVIAAPSSTVQVASAANVDHDIQPQVLRRDRLAEIYRLADEGYPSRDIAEQLHSAVGDVELILSLPRS